MKLSNSLLIIIINLITILQVAQAQYCVPNYTFIPDGTDEGDYLDGVQLVNISNTSSGSIVGPHYNDYSASQSTILYRGVTYYLVVTNCPNYPENVAAWIDYNKNDTLDDPGELLGEISLTQGETDTITFAVPPGALLDSTRLRVRLVFSITGIDPCDTTYIYGETEDYTVIIQDQPTNDVGVIAIDAPIFGCGLSTTENITIRVENFGTGTQSSVPVSYRINGGPAVTDTIFSIISPGDTVTFTFATPADLSAPVNFIESWTSLPTDTAFFNDSADFTVINTIVITTFPYFEDFELGQGSWFAGGINSSWAFGTPAKFVINSAGSGVNSWVTGSLDTFNYNPDEHSQVFSPCFDFSGLLNPIIELNIWWNSAFSDGTVFQSSIDNGASWQNVGAVGDPFNWFNAGFISGQPGGQPQGWAGIGVGWVIARHSLTGLAGQSNVRFRIAFGSNFLTEDDGFAFDDISISDPLNDVGVIAIDAPNSGCALTATENVTIRVKNFGINTQDTIRVGYTINAGPVIFDTIFGLLNPGDTVTFTFDTLADLSIPGSYIFDAGTALPTDADPSNNVISGHFVEHYNTVSAAAPTAVDSASCGPDSLLLSVIGTADAHFWYDSIVAGNLVEIADTFITPILSSTTTYYAEGRSVTSDSLPTTFAAGAFPMNGNMFDITAKNPVLILYFYGHPVVNDTIEIYFKRGSYVGFETNPFAWTFIGSDTVVAQPFGIPTIIPIIVDVFIPAGGTVAFYITTNGGSNLRMTTGTNEGNVFVEDASIQVREGITNSYPFGPNFTPYIWNGIVRYETAVCPSARTPVTAIIDSVPVVNLGPDTSFCGSIILDAQNSGAGYLWSSGDTTQTITADTNGIYWVDVTNPAGCTTRDSITLTIITGVKVNLNVFLEGAYLGGDSMRDSLYLLGYLDRYLSGGPASINMNPGYPIPSDTSGNAVDVIGIQIRSNPFTPIDTAYAWLMQDGSIRDFETGQNNYAQVCGLAPGTYYIAVGHRNHLFIMYNDSASLNLIAPPPIDLTNVINIYGGGIGFLGDGPYGMWAANARNSDQETNANDLYDVSVSRDVLLTGYNLSDVNLTGVVNANDFNIASYNNDQLYWSTVP